MKTILLTLLLLPCILGAKAQTATPDRPARYKLFFEKPYLHTDRETYAGGQDIWFKAYLVNGQNNQLFNSSNNLYVELISPDAKIVGRKTIRLDNGLGKGDFHLADSIPPGTWRIRAYTNWMRNFGDNFVFEKQIRIFSEASKVKSGLITQSRYKKVNRRFDVPENTIDSAAIRKSIRFFPEGGSMTEDVTGTVAFKTDDGYGGIAGVKGTIETQAGKVVASINSANGIGSFLLTPAPGIQYIARGTYTDGESFVAPLPQSLLTGLSLSAGMADKDLALAINTNMLTLTNYKGKTALITIKNKGKVMLKKELIINGLTTRFTIPQDTLQPGISEITLFDHLGRPRAERLIYTDEKNIAKLTLIADQKTYGPKEKVTLQVKLTDEHHLPLKAHLSLSAVDASLTGANATDIVSYINLQSEIRGKIDHPGQYFDTTNTKRKEQLDLLLLTQGWRDFTWKRIADSAIRISYNLEQGMTISGRVRRVWVNHPIKGVDINLRTYKVQADKNIKASSGIYQTITDSSGRFYMDGIEIYGLQLVRISSFKSKGQAGGILEQDSVIIPPLEVQRIALAPLKADEKAGTPKDSITEKFIEASKKRRFTDTVRLHTVSITARNPKIKIKSVAKYKIDDRFQKSYNTVIAFLLGENMNTFPARGRGFGIMLGSRDGEPRKLNFIINGYLGLGPRTENDYLTLPMMEVEALKLEIFTDAKGTGGNVYLTVKPDAFSDLNVKYCYVNGYDEAREFYAPKQETADTKPDPRTATIYWAPDITTNENGEATVTYYNADSKTKVRIIAEGITNKGIPVAGTAGYAIK